MSKKAKPRALGDDEAVATATSLRTSAIKLNLLAQQIRGLDVNRAVAELSFSPRRIAKDVKKVLQSAIANAENNHQLDVDRLYVAEATVGRAMVMKRMHPRARGRGFRIEKPFSKLRVVVRERGENEGRERAEKQAEE